jgi:hypothetical protein
MIVFDLNDAPMILDQVRIHVDLVLPNLFDAVVSKDFRKKEVYSKMLMQPQDGPEYEEFQFSATMIDQASVVFVSAAETVDPEVTSKFVLLRVES